jgi:hypothetical protein
MVKQIIRTRTFRVVISLLVSLVTLALAFRNVSVKQIGIVLRETQWIYALMALVSVGVNTVGKIFRWQIMLGSPGKMVPLGVLSQGLLAGQMLNVVFPARVGDIYRAVVIGGLGPGRAFVLGTVVLEKIIDILMYIFLFVLLLLLIPLPEWIGFSVYTFAGISLLLAIAAFALAYERNRLERLVSWIIPRLPARIRDYTSSRLRSALSSLDILQNKNDLVKIAIWTAIIWTTAIVNNQLILLAVGITLPWTASLLVLVALQAGISLPSVPGRIGVFEYICVLALAAYGVSRAEALTYGILLHAIVLLPTTLLGLISFWMLGIGIRENPDGLANTSEPVPQEGGNLPGKGR